MNFDANMLANATYNLCPSGDFSHNKFSGELIYRPSIPDTIKNWRVFQDDEKNHKLRQFRR